MSCNRVACPLKWGQQVLLSSGSCGEAAGKGEVQWELKYPGEKSSGAASCEGAIVSQGMGWTTGCMQCNENQWPR